jgi:hypothetical protein
MKVRIFLASSSEMAPERTDFRYRISVKNELLHRDGIFLEIVQWESFSSHVSRDGKQVEYNKAICECDMAVFLFHRKAGKYTVEEFDTAVGHYREHGRPLIYTYFKGKREDVTEAAESDTGVADLKLFLKRVEEVLKHYCTWFRDMNDLWCHFDPELNKFLSEKKKEPAGEDSAGKSNTITDIQGDGNVVVSNSDGTSISININKS